MLPLIPPGATLTRNAEGPVWAQHPNGSWVLPTDVDLDDTLGWAFISFIERWLQHNGKPVKLTDEQTRQVLWGTAIQRDSLQLAFPTWVITRVKGTGKDFLAAAWCLWQFLGACKPQRAVDGTVTAVRPANPWVVVLATSLDQTRNTSLYFRGLLTEEAVEHFGVDIGREISYAGDGRLECVTSNAVRLEGSRPTAISCTEIGLWTPRNAGDDLYAAVERSAAKIPGTQVFATSNAYAKGGGSVLEAIHKDYTDLLVGRMSAKASGILYDSLSAPKDTNPSDADSLYRGIKEAIGDAHWLDVDRMHSLALSKRTLVENTLRFTLNIPASPEEALYDSLHWEQNEDTSLSLAEGDTIALGLDVSLSDDSSALVAVRISDRAAFPLLIVEKPIRADDSWRVDVSLFDAAIGQAMEKYDVVAFFSDVNPIQGHVERWEAEYGEKMRAKFDTDHAISADMRQSQRRFTLAHESLMAAIESGQLPHNGDRILGKHVLNAHRRPNRYGMSFGKSSRGSADKVDAYAALLLADMARSVYLKNAPAAEPKKRRRSSFARRW